MEKKKTIFFITSRFPYPLEKGDKLRAYHQIKSLSKSYNIILCSLTEIRIKEEWEKEVSQYCTKVVIFKLNKFLIGLNLFKAIFNSKKPLQVAYFFQKSIYRSIQHLIRINKPDAIYCQLIRTAEYVKNIHHIPKTIDYMDALSEGMFKREKISKGLNKLLYKSEGKRLKKYENIIFDYFNHHTIISKQDRDKISHPKNQSIYIIPNGVDDFFLKYKCNASLKEFDIVFVGNLSYAPNIESCIYLIEQIVPYFKAKNVEIKVLLSGATPSPTILNAIKNISNVVVSGWVDDIRESYCKGKIFVAPLFIGTGLQNKLLEAMALGVPCVTTPLVNNALNAKPNENILLATNKEAFFNQITTLLQNQEYYIQISKSAKKFVINNYNWDNFSVKIPIF
jgi:sugar transferase (PEP-CTERM/EpsH1 system associated)